MGCVKAIETNETYDLDVINSADKGYNGHLNFICAYLSHIIYENDDSEMSTLINEVMFGSHQVKVSSHETILEFTDIIDWHLKVAIFDYEETSIVIFRGTGPIINWVENLHFNLVDFNYQGVDVKIHAGFKSAVEKLQLFISKNTKNKIIYTGHSLGGALAILAPYICNTREKVVSVYTYGQPRPGDESFAFLITSTLDDRYFRVTDRHDYVPHIPLSGHPIFGHIPKLPIPNLPWLPLNDIQDGWHYEHGGAEYIDNIINLDEYEVCKTGNAPNIYDKHVLNHHDHCRYAERAQNNISKKLNIGGKVHQIKGWRGDNLIETNKGGQEKDCYAQPILIEHQNKTHMFTISEEKRIRHYSRSDNNKWIDKGYIEVNGKTIQANGYTSFDAVSHNNRHLNVFYIDKKTEKLTTCLLSYGDKWENGISIELDKQEEFYAIDRLSVTSFHKALYVLVRIRGQFVFYYLNDMGNDYHLREHWSHFTIPELVQYIYPQIRAFNNRLYISAVPKKKMPKNSQYEYWGDDSVILYTPDLSILPSLQISIAGKVDFKRQSKKEKLPESTLSLTDGKLFVTATEALMGPGLVKSKPYIYYGEIVRGECDLKKISKGSCSEITPQAGPCFGRSASMYKETDHLLLVYRGHNNYNSRNTRIFEARYSNF